MASAFDRIIIAVPDLSAAVSEYGQLLSAQPAPASGPAGEPAAWIGLHNTVIELRQDEVDRACIRGLALSDAAAAPADTPVENRLGLEVCLCDGGSTAAFREREQRARCNALQVDHLVLRTDDAAACIALFADELGIRLALDRTVPEWGGRMLFFRAGRLTLEVIESDREESTGSFFWGLAYQCPDIAETATRLRTGGVQLSEIRDGRKPGTRVATVHSHCLGIPTLLISDYSPELRETL